MSATRANALTDPWMLGSLRVPNRVLLAPLAGIGNWFVRLQAKRYGAGMAVSEMVSSHAIHYGNEKTCTEMLRIDPRERERGPVSIQLFGEDPAIMRSAAAHVATLGADAIDINMGCPVPEGAARQAPAPRCSPIRTCRCGGARRGRGCRRESGRVGLPVTVKLRSGLRAGERAALSLRTAWSKRRGVAAIAFHPRSAAVQHKGTPDYALAARLVAARCLRR